MFFVQHNTEMFSILQVDKPFFSFFALLTVHGYMVIYFICILLLQIDELQVKKHSSKEWI